MKNIKVIFLSCFFIFATYDLVISQSKFISTTISNTTTGLPVIAYPDLFYTQFHPGIEATYGWQMNKSPKNKLYVNANLGYYHHQFVQSLVKIYPTVLYERKLSDRFNLNAGLGAGYGLSFEGKNAFALQDDGTYENKPFLGARSQYLIALELGVVYSISREKVNTPQLILGFKSYMQGTYVKSYVPLLPLNSLNIGIRFPLKNIEK